MAIKRIKVQYRSCFNFNSKLHRTIEFLNKVLEPQTQRWKYQVSSFVFIPLLQIQSSSLLHILYPVFHPLYVLCEDRDANILKMLQMLSVAWICDNPIFSHLFPPFLHHFATGSANRYFCGYIPFTFTFHFSSSINFHSMFTTWEEDKNSFF